MLGQCCRKLFRGVGLPLFASSVGHRSVVHFIQPSVRHTLPRVAGDLGGGDGYIMQKKRKTGDDYRIQDYFEVSCSSGNKRTMAASLSNESRTSTRENSEKPSPSETTLVGNAEVGSNGAAERLGDKTETSSGTGVAKSSEEKVKYENKGGDLEFGKYFESSSRTRGKNSSKMKSSGTVYPNPDVREKRRESGRRRGESGAKVPSERRVENVNDHCSGFVDMGQGALVGYWGSVWGGGGSEDLLNALLSEVNWVRKEVTVHGRKCMQPRMICYMADSPDLTYTYSRLKLDPDPYSNAVLKVKEKVEEIAGERFNCVLLNLYRDGKDHMGWHSDNEKLFGSQPTIASVSFGTRRDFVLRLNTDSSQKHTYQLGDGDVLVMKGTTQDFWQHSVPKRMRVVGERVNLTFRRIVKPEQ